MKRYVDSFLVAGTAFVVYLGNLGNGFVYDDRFLVEQNPLVQNLDWWGLLTTGYWHGIVDAGLYRPLTLLSFGLNRALGASAASFHLVNDALHAGTSVLVLLTARSLGASRFVSLAAGLLFALHPIQTEAVDSIVGRAEILALMFALAAFLLYTRGGKPILFGLLFFLALCSKESAAFSVSLFVLYWFFFEKKSLWPAAIAAAAYGALRFAVLGGFGISGREIGFLDNPVAQAGLGTRLLTAPILLAKYTGLVLWPYALSADYSYDQIPTTLDIRVPLGLSVALGLGALAWKRRSLAAFAALAFLVPLSGMLHILFPLGTFFAERLMYLPMFGAALFLALGLAAVPRGSGILLGVLLAASGARVVARHADWHDNETLFRKTVKTSPRSARSHFLLGAELLHQSRYLESVAAFKKGLTIAPQHVGARVSLGEALLEAGEPSEARDAFEKAFRREPSPAIRERVVTAALAAGRRKAREGDWTGALAHFERARALDRNNTEAPSSAGLVLERLGDVERAESLYEEALAIDADDVRTILNLAGLRGNAGDLAGAEALFRRAIALAPSSYEAYNGLGVALAGQGRVDEAKAAFSAAMAIDPDMAAAHDHLRALGRKALGKTP